jgi:MFS family permease
MQQPARAAAAMGRRPPALLSRRRLLVTTSCTALPGRRRAGHHHHVLQRAPAKSAGVVGATPSAAAAAAVAGDDKQQQQQHQHKQQEHPEDDLTNGSHHAHVDASTSALHEPSNGNQNHHHNGAASASAASAATAAATTTTTATTTTATTTPSPSSPLDPDTTALRPWRSVALVTALTLWLANAHRSAFAALLPPLLPGLALTPSAAGALQAAMLAGYLAGQVPAGVWADRLGGPRVLLWSCAGWSVATGLTAAAVAWAASASASAAASSAVLPLAALVCARFLFGLCSAGVMPCVAAMAVRWIPKRQRAASTSLVYAAFNLGGVAALACAPWAAEACCAAGGAGAGAGATGAAAASTSSTAGAAGALLVLGAAGVAWAAAGGAWLQRLWRRAQEQQQKLQLTLSMEGDDEGGGGGGGSTSEAAAAASAAASAAAAPTPAPPASSSTPLMPRPADPDSAREVFTLCFAHGVIGCGFFLLSGLMPLILASIGGGGGAGGAAPPLSSSSPSLTALPWLVAAATGVLAGRLADAAIARGYQPLRVRRAFQTASFALCAASVLPLAAPERSAAILASALGYTDAGAVCPRAFAACALTANLVSYSMSFGGFHAYLQDVGSRCAGVLQGLTNSTSVACGAAATLFCGWAGQAHGGYGAAFAALAGLYALGAWVWAWGARGDRVRLVGVGG